MAKQTWRAGNMLYPVPAVMVSCADSDGNPNIITVAWAGTTCSSPAMVSISVRPERYSYGLIKDRGEFVINLTTKALVRATDYCGVRSGRDVDKFKEMGLTPCKMTKVEVPGIKESPVNIECKVTQIVKLGSHDMFVAEVVAVNVDEELLDEKGRFELNSAGLVAYSHGEYFELGENLGKFGFSVRKDNQAEKKAKADKVTEAKKQYGKNQKKPESLHGKDRKKPECSKEKTGRKHKTGRRQQKQK